MKTTTTSHDFWHNSFDACVVLLQEAACKLDPYWPGGMDYCKINVILFCFILPILFGFSLARNAYLLLRLF